MFPRDSTHIARTTVESRDHGIKMWASLGNLTWRRNESIQWEPNLIGPQIGSGIPRTDEWRNGLDREHYGARSSQNKLVKNSRTLVTHPEREYTYAILDRRRTQCAMLNNSR